MSMLKVKGIEARGGRMDRRKITFCSLDIILLLLMGFGRPEGYDIVTESAASSHDLTHCGVVYLVAVAQWVDPLGDPPTGGSPPCRPRAERVAASSTRLSAQRVFCVNPITMVFF
jgi:hypothetical protein